MKAVKNTRPNKAAQQKKRKAGKKKQQPTATDTEQTHTDTNKPEVKHDAYALSIQTKLQELISSDAYGQTEHPQKRKMLCALVLSLGVVTAACEASNTGRTTHYEWITNDPEYAKLVKDIDNITIDFVEGKLLGLINKGDTIATIFFLKTRGKKRGYVERTELTGAEGEPLRAFDWDELYAAAKRNTTQQ